VVIDVIRDDDDDSGLVCLGTRCVECIVPW